MPTGKVPNLSRRKTLILSALLLAFMLQAGSAEAAEKTLTVKINQIQDGAGRAVAAGTATIKRKDGKGARTTAEIKDGKLEHTRKFVDADYEIRLEGKDPEGKDLKATVSLPVGEINTRQEGDEYLVGNAVSMLAAGDPQPSPSESPSPDGTPQPAATASPTPTPTLQEEVSSLKKLVSDQGTTLGAIDGRLQLIAGLLGLLALVELVRAAHWFLRGRNERPLEVVERNLATVRDDVASIRQNLPSTIKNALTAARSEGGQQPAETGASREAAQQNLGDQRAEFSTPPDGSGDAGRSGADAGSGEGTAQVAEVSLQDTAVQSYRNLVQGTQTLLKPIYVRAVVTGSPNDALGGGGPVSLQETHSGGAYVLFGRGDEGFVFPNPILPYSPALRPVFPKLTEPDFEGKKETITPARATRSGDGWKAEADT
jgi:hypothetical protein